MAVVTLTDRPKSVRNRCVIELFVSLFVLSLCPFDMSAIVWAFVIGLSHNSSFLVMSSVRSRYLYFFIWIMFYYQARGVFLLIVSSLL